MLPLKDNNPTTQFPIITVIIIVVNCLVYVYQLTLSPRLEQMFIFQFGLIPVELTSFSDMTPDVPFPVWMSPFTSMFLHGDFMHLAGNMLYLWIFGNNVEDYLGHLKFLGFYFISGLAAVLLFTSFNPGGTVPLVGASGAIAGVLGAYLVVWPRAKILTLIWILFFIRLMWLPAIFILGYWFVIQLLMGFSSLGAAQSGGVAWFAHIGGFLFGWIFIRLKYKKQLASKKTDSPQSDYYNRWH
ncbi:MAG: rhomboid family intramembrane serine protease [Candidatus Zixiibacteriota bacterium]